MQLTQELASLTTPFLCSKRGQTTNQFEIRFRATSGDGLLVWLNKGTTLTGDYLAIAINGGFIELSYNLGKQQTLHIVRSKVRLLFIFVGIHM